MRIRVGETTIQFVVIPVSGFPPPLSMQIVPLCVANPRASNVGTIPVGVVVTGSFTTSVLDQVKGAAFLASLIVS